MAFLKESNLLTDHGFGFDEDSEGETASDSDPNQEEESEEDMRAKLTHSLTSTLTSTATCDLEKFMQMTMEQCRQQMINNNQIVAKTDVSEAGLGDSTVNATDEVKMMRSNDEVKITRSNEEIKTDIAVKDPSEATGDTSEDTMSSEKKNCRDEPIAKADDEVTRNETESSSLEHETVSVTEETISDKPIKSPFDSTDGSHENIQESGDKSDESARNETKRSIRQITEDASVIGQAKDINVEETTRSEGSPLEDKHDPDNNDQECETVADDTVTNEIKSNSLDDTCYADDNEQDTTNINDTNMIIEAKTSCSMEDADSAGENEVGSVSVIEKAGIGSLGDNMVAEHDNISITDDTQRSDTGNGSINEVNSTEKENHVNIAEPKVRDSTEDETNGAAVEDGARVTEAIMSGETKRRSLTETPTTSFGDDGITNETKISSIEGSTGVGNENENTNVTEELMCGDESCTPEETTATVKDEKEGARNLEEKIWRSKENKSDAIDKKDITEEQCSSMADAKSSSLEDTKNRSHANTKCSAFEETKNSSGEDTQKPCATPEATIDTAGVDDSTYPQERVRDEGKDPVSTQSERTLSKDDSTEEQDMTNDASSKQLTMEQQIEEDRKLAEKLEQEEKARSSGNQQPYKWPILMVRTEQGKAHNIPVVYCNKPYCTDMARCRFLRKLTEDFKRVRNGEEGVACGKKPNSETHIVRDGRVYRVDQGYQIEDDALLAEQLDHIEQVTAAGWVYFYTDQPVLSLVTQDGKEEKLPMRICLKHDCPRCINLRLYIKDFETMLERRGLNRDQDRGGRYRDEDYDDYGDYRPRGREGRDGRGYGNSRGRVRDSDYYVDEYGTSPRSPRDAPRSYQNPERGGFDRGTYEGGYRLGGGDRGGYTNRRPPYMERYRPQSDRGGILRSRSYEDGYYPGGGGRGYPSGSAYGDDYYPLDEGRRRRNRNEDDFYPLDETKESGRTYGDRYYPRDAGSTTGSTYEGGYRLGSREGGEYTDPQDSEALGSFVYLDENGEIIMSDDLGVVGNPLGDATGSEKAESEKSSRQNEKTKALEQSGPTAEAFVSLKTEAAPIATQLANKTNTESDPAGPTAETSDHLKAEAVSIATEIANKAMVISDTNVTDETKLASVSPNSSTTSMDGAKSTEKPDEKEHKGNSKDDSKGATGDTKPTTAASSVNKTEEPSKGNIDQAKPDHGRSAINNQIKQQSGNATKTMEEQIEEDRKLAEKLERYERARTEGMRSYTGPILMVKTDAGKFHNIPFSPCKRPNCTSARCHFVKTLTQDFYRVWQREEGVECGRRSEREMYRFDGRNMFRYEPDDLSSRDIDPDQLLAEKLDHLEQISAAGVVYTWTDEPSLSIIKRGGGELKMSMRLCLRPDCRRCRDYTRYIQDYEGLLDRISEGSEESLFREEHREEWPDQYVDPTTYPDPSYGPAPSSHRGRRGGRNPDYGYGSGGDRYSRDHGNRFDPEDNRRGGGNIFDNPPRYRGTYSDPPSSSYDYGIAGSRDDYRPQNRNPDRTAYSPEGGSSSSGSHEGFFSYADDGTVLDSPRRPSPRSQGRRVTFSDESASGRVDSAKSKDSGPTDKNADHVAGATCAEGGAKSKGETSPSTESPPRSDIDRSGLLSNGSMIESAFTDEEWGHIQRNPMNLLRYMGDRQSVRSRMRGADISESEYEELWSLAERLGEVRPRGMTTYEIGHMPTMQYKESDEPSSMPKEEQQCKVCMEDFTDGENLRTLPCMHRYHQYCIDHWIRSNALCPICRINIVEALNKNIDIITE